MKHLISVPTNIVPHFHKIAELNNKDWFVSSDPENQKIGSGGGTAHILYELYTKDGDKNFLKWLQKEYRVIIHAGGESRRLPAYAPLGKSLIPMPVFRWSRAQHLNQRLVHLQAPLFEKILEKAPNKLNTLVASGDTLIFSGKQLPEIPDADVVCFGLWLEPDKASRHGVFFAKHKTPNELEFMLQKPSISKIREMVHNYFFLMDIGIWLLSPKAISVLMNNCGWRGNSFISGIPNFYDLYSDFGTALGKLTNSENKEINKLSVALVNLEGGQFFHLGNTFELLSSCLNIQNRVNDQREIWHKHVKPHPSIFVLNSAIKNNFTSNNQNIWVENSSIPDSWKLKQNHVLTGIPENNWHLNLDDGNCLDIIPLVTGDVVIRNYGFTDCFRGTIMATTTQFMNMPLEDWLSKRNLSDAFKDCNNTNDIFNLPLFTVLPKEYIDNKFLQWLLQNNPKHNIHFTAFWKKCKRISCAEINQLNDIKKTETQRSFLRSNNYPALAANYQQSVFYQLDLKKVAHDFVAHNLEIPMAPVPSNDDWLPIHDLMFRSYYNQLKNKSWKKEANGAFEYLQKQIVDIYKEQKVKPTIKLLPDQIAWGRSPVRLDIAGGWTDTPPYCFLYGGKVINVAVELNGQPPLHCYIKATNKKEIILRSIDLGAREELKTFDDIRSFAVIQSAFSIPKAAVALCGFLPEFCSQNYASLQEQLEAIGSGLEITILAAVPKGSGLGTSSILAATVLGTMAEVCCLNWGKAEIGKRTLALEQLLTTGGGWQDQFGGLLEGLKILETKPGKQQDPLVKWLPESIICNPKYKNRILLYYTGITRVAKNILYEIVRGMFLNSHKHLDILEELKRHANNTYEVLLQKDFDKFADMIDRSWQLNQKIDSGTNTPEIQLLIDKISPYLLGQKLLGAGGGGFMLMLAKDQKAAVQIKNELNNNPVNPRGRFVNFEVSTTGFQVTKS